MIAITNGMNSTPSAAAVAWASGNATAAAALLVTTSVRIMVRK